MDTHFGRAARKTPLQRRQLEIIVGSLLGDGTLLPTTLGFCFRVHHGLAQRVLVDWKYAQLDRFVRTAPRRSGNGYYFRTVSHPTFSELRAAFYDDKRKIVPFDVLEIYLTPLAIAVWLMDDGASDGRQIRINTQSFSVSEAVGLAVVMKMKYGVSMTVNLDKRKPRLRVAAKSMKVLTGLVSPYFVPEMLYKLPPH